jgi:hypothetical protein
MKTHPIRRLFRAVILGVAVATLVGGPVMAQKAADLNTVFQQGRAAFYKGDIAQAKVLLAQVLSVAPNHFESKALMAQIMTYDKGADTSSKATYSAVVLPKVDFSDVTLSEACQGLAVMAKTTTQWQGNTESHREESRTWSAQAHPQPLEHPAHRCHRVHGSHDQIQGRV